MIGLKRAYDAPMPSDGRRYLVERLWPRGVRKADLPLDGWIEDVAPSPELRRWFGHEPRRWYTFRQRYLGELRRHTEALMPLLEAARHGPVTLVYGARDTEHKAAVVLREYLHRLLRDDSRRSAYGELTDALTSSLVHSLANFLVHPYRGSHMKLFLDTAAIDEIRTAARWGILAGVTTNPSLFAEVGGRYDDVLKQICELTPGPVSAEVVAADVPGMLREGRHFAQLARNIVVKIPMCEEGLEAIARLAREDIPTNCTLIFSANQGLLAANAGASFLSPFVGRLDDINEHGMEVVRDLAAIVRAYGLDAKVLAASLRHPRHVTEAALAGADIATVPPKILRQMMHHPLSESGIARFRQDWDTVHARQELPEQAGAEAGGLAHDREPWMMSEHR